MQSNRKRNNRRSSQRTSVPNALSRQPPVAYAGQQRVTLTVPAAQAILSTTVTTGVIANVFTLGSASIQGFATRFASTFDEYRIVGCNLKIRCVAASTGITVFYFDEKSNAAPAAIDGQERIAVRVPNTNAAPASSFNMRWRARDLLDLEFSAIGTATTPVYFKTYTDLANFGAPVAATALWYIEAEFLVEFRGLHSA